jgi:hypothetical protein
LEKFSNLLLVPPAVATETGHHEVVTLLRQELGPVSAIKHKPNKGTVSGGKEIVSKRDGKMFCYEILFEKKLKSTNRWYLLTR